MRKGRWPGGGGGGIFLKYSGRNWARICTRGRAVGPARCRTCREHSGEREMPPEEPVQGEEESRQKSRRRVAGRPEGVVQNGDQPDADEREEGLHEIVGAPRVQDCDVGAKVQGAVEQHEAVEHFAKVVEGPTSPGHQLGKVLDGHGTVAQHLPTGMVADHVEACAHVPAILLDLAGERDGDLIGVVVPPLPVPVGADRVPRPGHVKHPPRGTSLLQALRCHGSMRRPSGTSSTRAISASPSLVGLVPSKPGLRMFKVSIFAGSTLSRRPVEYKDVWRPRSGLGSRSSIRFQGRGSTS